jgi:hypothetical protein
VLGFETDALNNTLRWRLPAQTGAGVRRLAMGQATISAVTESDEQGRRLNIQTDRSFTLIAISDDGKERTFACPAGASTWLVG